MKELIDKLANERVLSKQEFVMLVENFTAEDVSYAALKANAIREKYYKKDVYVRGLIEFTSFCKNDCYYCGLRKSNKLCQRYRLTKEQILACCEKGNNLQFKTFVLQGGEDDSFSDDDICDIVSSIKSAYKDVAVTLSIGERSKESFKRFFEAGADRYLLRHESATASHYSRLHPQAQQLSKRQECLYNLKEIGFQTGAGFMVGSPFQTSENVANDLLFLKELSPQMVGVGPFIPHKDTPFKDFPAGSTELTLFLLSIIRLMLPNVLMPATTALGTLLNDGRERGILSGANVVMPCLSESFSKGKYLLYNGKNAAAAEDVAAINLLAAKIAKIGYNLSFNRGDAERILQNV